MLIVRSKQWHTNRESLTLRLKNFTASSHFDSANRPITNMQGATLTNTPIAVKNCFLNLRGNIGRDDATGLIHLCARYYQSLS